MGIVIQDGINQKSADRSKEKGSIVEYHSSVQGRDRNVFHRDIALIGIDSVGAPVDGFLVAIQRNPIIFDRDHFMRILVEGTGKGRRIPGTDS